jgi:hypothetical protein
VEVTDDVLLLSDINLVSSMVKVVVHPVAEFLIDDATKYLV